MAAGDELQATTPSAGPRVVEFGAHLSCLAGRRTCNDPVTLHSYLRATEDHRRHALKIRLRFAVQVDEAAACLARRFRQQRRSLRPRGYLFDGLLEEIFHRENSAANRIQEVANAATIGRDDRYPRGNGIDHDEWLGLVAVDRWK